MKKARILSVILTLCLILSVMSLGMISAAAEDGSYSVTAKDIEELKQEYQVPKEREQEQIEAVEQVRVGNDIPKDGEAGPVGLVRAEAPANSGAWEFSDIAVDNLTDDEKAVFEKAIEGIGGAALVAKDVIATQVVSGMNYAFLCTSTPVVPDPISHWCIATVYVDTKREVKLIGIQDIDVADVKMQENAPEGGDGSWTSTAKAKSALVPNDVREALEENVGLTLSPIAVLGTQIVSGINYRILAYGTPVVPNAITSLKVVDVYSDAEGNTSITNISDFDLNSYISKPAADEPEKEEPTADPNSKSPNTGRTSSPAPVILLILFAIAAAGVSVYGISRKRG